jgi:glycosyltransferase involved in cell wall biosynthesis
MAKVTIGMPVCNGAAYVADAIGSILAQTYDDFELVISDNASTDTTAEICLCYAKLDPRIRYTRQQLNLGVHANHMYVFRHSRSAYFKWAAHDDILAPAFIEKCVQILDRDEGVVNVAPDSVLISDDGSLLRYSGSDKAMGDNNGHSWLFPVDKNGNLASNDVVARFAAAVLHTHASSNIYGLMRRAALERTSIMPNYVGADKVVLVELSLLGRYHLLHEPLIYRRFHIHQAGAKNPKTSTHTLKIAAAYIRAIVAAQVTSPQRARCLGIIGRRALARALRGANR